MIKVERKYIFIQFHVKSFVLKIEIEFKIRNKINRGIFLFFWVWVRESFYVCGRVLTFN